jgi:acyl-CoA thioester hydrolase
MSETFKSDRQNFPVFRTISTRWMDVDSYGHVNNVEYLSYFDTAVNGWYLDNALIDMINGQEIFLVVETQCRYLGEIKFPDQVHAGLRVVRVGNSSVSYEIALFRNDENKACAEGHFVHVLVDRSSRRPVALGNHHRRVFSDAEVKVSH